MCSSIPFTDVTFTVQVQVLSQPQVVVHSANVFKGCLSLHEQRVVVFGWMTVSLIFPLQKEVKLAKSGVNTGGKYLRVHRWG